MKPPRGLFKVGCPRISLMDEMEAHGKSIPAPYPVIEINKTHARPYQQVKMYPDSDKVKELKLKASKPDKSPSPVTYKVAEALEKSCGSSF